jgi:hypothetical protein
MDGRSGRAEGTLSLFRNQQFRWARVYIFLVIWSFPNVQTVSDGCLFYLERRSKNRKSANGFEMKARSLLLIACLVSAFSCFFYFILLEQMPGVKTSKWISTILGRK